MVTAFCRRNNVFAGKSQRSWRSSKAVRKLGAPGCLFASFAANYLCHALTSTINVIKRALHVGRLF